jgi:hypothetical protein
MSAEKHTSAKASAAQSPPSSPPINAKPPPKLPIYQSIPTHSAIETAIDDVEILETSFVVSSTIIFPFGLTLLVFFPNLVE